MRTACTMFALAVLSAGCDATLNHVIGIANSGGGGQATHLVFTVQPSGAAAGAAITPAVQVAAKDASGNTDTTYVNNVTIAIGADPGLGSLSGNTTLPAVKGVATFGNLSISSAASGYTLTAAASGLTGVTSVSFNITP